MLTEIVLPVCSWVHSQLEWAAQPLWRALTGISTIKRCFRNPDFTKVHKRIWSENTVAEVLSETWSKSKETPLLSTLPASLTKQLTFLSVGRAQTRVSSIKGINRFAYTWNCLRSQICVRWRKRCQTLSPLREMVWGQIWVQSLSISTNTRVTGYFWSPKNDVLGVVQDGELGSVKLTRKKVTFFRKCSVLEHCSVLELAQKYYVTRVLRF